MPDTGNTSENRLGKVFALMDLMFQCKGWEIMAHEPNPACILYL